MAEALKQAQIAYEEGEVPVGAVVVANNKIIARGYNQTEKLHDVTAHAEMIALTSAFDFMGAKYLPDCTLYGTLEPCNMCGGALYWSQIGKVVFGASDPKRGYRATSKNIIHPKTEVISGVLETKSKALIDAFFERIRK